MLGCKDVKLVTFLPVSTATTSNNKPTGGSVTSEICVASTIQACNIINKLLEPHRAKTANLSWPVLCKLAIEEAGLDLRAIGRVCFTAPPDSGESKDSYQTWGACVFEVELDLLTGMHNSLRADILMDLGVSMNPLLDVGQIEGAFLMGVGLHTLEEVVYNSSDGTLFTKDTWEYKIPGAHNIPIDWRVALLPNAPNPRGILRSRAVGEPPLLMGGAALFAIRAAIQAARGPGRFRFDSPASVSNIVNTLAREGVYSQENLVLK